MQVTSEVKARVVAKIKEGLELANKFYNKDWTMPTIKFAKRGTTAGTANGSRWEVNFNAILLMENQDDFIARTVPHEVAHLIDYKVNPENFESDVQWTGRGYRRTKRDLHGADFKFIMERVLQADDSSRCHNYDTSTASVKKSGSVEYRCTCGCNQIVTLGAKRHNKEQAKPGTYFLRGHRLHGKKANLELVGGQTPATTSSHIRPNPITPPTKTPSYAGSVKDQAKRVFQTTESRGEFINRCVSELGMKKTTASTYHHNFNSGKW